MRLPTLLLVPAAAVAAALAFTAGPASAGETNGNGDYTPAITHASSICVYSGLQDGDDNDDGIPEGPHGPGTPPQNWGHTLQGAKANGGSMDALKAMGLNPGASCNGHTGFLSGGGGE